MSINRIPIRVFLLIVSVCIIKAGHTNETDIFGSEAVNIALLVEDSTENYEVARLFIKSSTNQLKREYLDRFWLFTFNATGTTLLTENGTRYETILSLMNKPVSLELSPSNKSTLLDAVYHTANILPANGNVIIFTKQNRINYTDAEKNLIKNKVYLLTPEKRLISLFRNDNNQRKARKMSRIKFPESQKSTITFPENWSLILSKNNLTNHSNLSFPTFRNIEKIHVIILPAENTTGTLTFPNGYSVAVSGAKSINLDCLKRSSFSNENDRLLIDLEFDDTNILKNGTWRLSLDNNRYKYSAQVYGVYSSTILDSSTENMSLLTSDNRIQNLNYIFGKTDSNSRTGIDIEITTGSDLIIVSSGRRAQIYFEIYNRDDNGQLVSFICSDANYILQSLSVYRKFIEKQSSALVTLYLNTRPGSYRDEITFTVKSGGTVYQKKVFVDVGSQIDDRTAPEIDYNFISDCVGILYSQCDTGIWTVQISARDTIAGLLQLTSSPKGLYVSQGFTSGTTDTVSGYYSNSCCNPDVQVIASDRLNNRRIYNLNAYNHIWTPGAISGLVIGLLLVIILISIGVVFGVRKWKQKQSYRLPTYRAGDI